MDRPDQQLDGAATECKCFAGAHYDEDLNSLIGADGQLIKLRPQSLQIFCLLAQQSGTVVSRQHLFDAVWSDVSVTDDSLVQCVSEIRRAIGDTDKRVLKTIPRLGYLLTADARTPKLPARLWRFKTDKLSPRTIMTTLLSVLILTLSVADTQQLSDSVVAMPSIAFSPIATSSDDFRLGILAQQISADIQTKLQSKEWLKLTTQGNNHQENDSHYVLSGDLNEAGDKLNIALTLEDVRRSSVAWEQSWTMPLEAFVRVEEDILEKLTQKVETLRPAAVIARQFKSVVPDSIKRTVAYRSVFYSGTETPRFTPEELMLARRYLEKVVEQDQQDEKSRIALAIARLLEAGDNQTAQSRSGIINRKFMRDYQNEFSDTASEAWKDGSMWQPHLEANRF